MRTFVPQRQRKCQRNLFAIRQVARSLVVRDTADVEHTCLYFVTVSPGWGTGTSRDSADQRTTGEDNWNLFNLSPLFSAFQVNKLSHLYMVTVKLHHRHISADEIHLRRFGSSFTDSTSLICSVAATKKAHGSHVPASCSRTQ